MSRSSRTRHGLVRPVGVPALAFAVSLAACGTAPPAPVPAPPSPAPAALLHYPHWDQVCREARASVDPSRVSEVFDTVGLGEAVSAVSTSGTPSGAGRPSVDFVTHYRADGRVEVSGLWAATIDSASATAVATLLSRRVKPLGPLLGRTSFRSHLELRPTPRLELRPAIDCLPHIGHEEGKPPTGLPAGVRLTQGRSMRPGQDASSEVRVSLAPSGEVTAVERRGGYDRTFRRAEAVIRGLHFDPPLSNGLPVEGSVVQTVTFDQPAPTTDAGLDSLFLVRQGFDRRAEAFDAALRIGPGEGTAGTPLARRLSEVAGVEVRSTTGAEEVFFAGAGCPAQVIVNGYTPPREGERRINLTPPPERNWLGSDPAVAEQISGVELYAPGAGAVADPDRCGALLVWSRGLEEGSRTLIVGSVEGGLPPSDNRVWREVMADPGGFRASVRPDGNFRFFGLHPGRYSLVVRDGGTIVAEGSVTVTAYETATVQWGR